ncbi:MAG: MBL fold metallo-hydrolase, partial [Candidatus Xenobia bacterium]
MKLKFWGTRGSIPCPGPKTLKYGGNTSCAELSLEGGGLLIFDSGSGIRELGAALVRRSGPQQGHIFLSHTHWDHIQGFPFFTPAFIPGNHFTIYAAKDLDKKLEGVLAGQMEHEYFPVKLNMLQAAIQFQELREGSFELPEGARVTVQYINHTALTLGYRIEAEGRTFAYCTDIEPNSRVLLRTDKGDPLARTTDREERLRDIVHEEDRRYCRFVQDLDVLVQDAMYTQEEYEKKVGWGHSPCEYATDIAMLAGVKHLIIFHHDPYHSDAFIDSMVDMCRQRAARYGSSLLVTAAREGEELSI